MIFVSTFDPASPIPGTKGGTIDISSSSPGQKIVLTNLSAVNIIINFDDGHTDILHAGQANMWTLDNVTPIIYWSQLSVLQVINPPISSCSVVLYGTDEEVQGTYPASLIYFSTIVNYTGVNVNSSGSGVSSIVNDGNALGTSIVESTPLGSGSSVVSLTNDGILTLDTVVAGVSKTMLQTVNTGGNSPLLGNAGSRTEALGDLQVDKDLYVTGIIHATGNIAGTTITNSGTLAVTGISTMTGSIHANGGVVSTTLSASGTLAVTGVSTMSGNINANGGVTATNVTTSGIMTSNTSFISNGTALFSGIFNDSYNDSSGNDGMSITPGSKTRIQSAGTITMQVPGGNDRLTITSTDVVSNVQVTATKYFLSAGSGQYNGYVGGFSRITSGTFVAGSPSGSVTHGLGAVPTWVLISTNQSGSTGTCGTSAWGNTTFSWNVGATGVQYNWVAWRS